MHADLSERIRRWLITAAVANGAMASAAFHFEQAGRFGQMVKAGYQAASQAERAGMDHTALMLYQKYGRT